MRPRPCEALAQHERCSLVFAVPGSQGQGTCHNFVTTISADNGSVTAPSPHVGDVHGAALPAVAPRPTVTSSGVTRGP